MNRQVQNLLDSSENVKHIRGVHFYLIATCFLLLATWSLAEQGDVEKANEQLRGISDVLKNWRDGDWLFRYAMENIILSDEKEASYQRWSLGLDGGNTSLCLQPVGPNWTLRPLPTNLKDFVENTGVGTISVKKEEILIGGEPTFAVKRPKSLADFKNLWNALDHRITVSRFKEVMREQGIIVTVVSSRYVPKPVKISRIPTEAYRPEMHKLVALTFSYIIPEWAEPCSDKFGQRFTHALTGNVLLSENTVMNSVILPATLEQDHFRGQEVMKHSFGVDWHEGPFSRSFAELDSITKNFQDLPFERLFPILEGEASRSQERLELFGAKLPIQDIGRWGSAILMALQIYLLLHMRTLRARINDTDPANAFPWIGIYYDPLAKASFIFSAIILPPLVLIILVTGNAYKAPTVLSLSVLTLGAIGSIFVAVLLFRVSIKIWKAVGH